MNVRDMTSRYVSVATSGGGDAVERKNSTAKPRAKPRATATTTDAAAATHAAMVRRMLADGVVDDGWSGLLTSVAPAARRAKGVQPYHISPTPSRKVFVDGKSRGDVAEAGAFVTPWAHAFVALATRTVVDASPLNKQAQRRVCIVAPNANFAEAVLRVTPKTTRVTLVLLAGLTRNVASVDELRQRYRSRLEVRVTGANFAAPLLFAAPEDAADHDVAVLDIRPVWHEATAAAMLLGVLELVFPRCLVPGGRALLIGTLPRTAEVGGRAWAAWAASFASFEVVAPVPTLMPSAPVNVVFDGFVKAVRIDGLRDSLLTCSSCTTTASPALKSHTARVDAAVVGAYASILAGLAGMEDKPRSPGPVSSSSIVDTGRGCPSVSYRGAMLVRRFEDEADADGEYAYVERARDYEPRCHWGQLKLMLSEWDFLNRTRDVWSSKPTVVVYAGAADGAHTPMLADLFPQVRRWLLFDGARFAPGVLRHPRIRAFSGKAGFVTDATVATFLRLAREEHAEAILFVSDIRINPTEADVQRDMVSQARWGIAMGAEAMLLKFRPPYAVDGGSASVPSASPGDFGSGDNGIALRVEDADAADIPHARRSLYLDGEVQPQLFAPMNSTEARLYARKPYALRYYDVLKHEQRSYFYNLTTRRLLMPDFLPRLDRLGVPGLDRGWESVQAYRIVLAYCGGDVGKATRTLGDAITRLGTVTGRADMLSHCTSETLRRYEKKQGEKLSASERRRIALWRELSTAQERDADAMRAMIIRSEKT